MAKKRGLGRGIGALIGPSASPSSAPADSAAPASTTDTPSRQQGEAQSEPDGKAKTPAKKTGGNRKAGSGTRASKSGASRSGTSSATSATRKSSSSARTNEPKASSASQSASDKPTTRKKAPSKRAGAAAKETSAAPKATEAPSAPTSSKGRGGASAGRASQRPVDMFFSGDPAQGAASTSRRRTDLADDWARDAQSKRRSSAKKTTRPKAADPQEAPVKPQEQAADLPQAPSTPDDVVAEASEPVDLDETAHAEVHDLADTNAAAAIDADDDPADEATADADDAEDAGFEGADHDADEDHAGEDSARSVDDAWMDDETDVELVPVPGAQFAEVPISEIRENPRNPRTVFDEDELEELAYSLREVGVLQPIVIRTIRAAEGGESFELVMGERRWRAARKAGLSTIPAIIRDTTDDDLLRDALLENLHRSQLNPLEEAAAYGQLLEDFGCTQEELSDRIGRSRPQISNTLRLLKLPPLVQRRLASGAISAGHARALLGLNDQQLQEELAQRIVNEGLSVRAVERLIASGVTPNSGTRTVVRRSSYNPRVVDMTSKLSNRLETPVRIDVGKRKGKVTLEFTNLADLDRLMERLGLDLDE